MLDYSLGKIYIITNTINDFVYVGSTAQKSIAMRMANHRRDALRGTQTPLHRAMLEFGNDSFTAQLYHAFPCNSKDELCAEEDQVMNKLILDGLNLYNVKINGKSSAETKARISANNARSNLGKTCSDSLKKKMSLSAMSKKNNHLQFGCLSLDANKGSPNWVYSYRHNKVTIRKSFSLKKYGEREAKQMAQAVRLSYHPSYPTNEESDTIDALMGITM
jgi:group I intron endonuclease